VNRPKRPKAFKRRKEGKTNYQLRLRLLKSRQPRLVVRRSLKHTQVQIVTHSPEGDKIAASAFSKELEKFGWKFSCFSTPAVYLTGLLCGTRAVKAGINAAVLDIGLSKPINKSNTYAALKGALDSGMKIPYGEEAIPSQERLIGTHISAYATLLKKEDKAKYEKIFSGYLKNKQDPEQISKILEQVKAKIVENK